MRSSTPTIALWFRKHLSASGAMKASKYLSTQAQIPEDAAADFCLWYHNLAVLRSQAVSNSLESISKALMKVAGSENKVSVNNQAALAVGVILSAVKCENTFIVDRYYAEACYTIAKLIVLIRDRSLLRGLASFLETHRVPSKIKPLPIKLLEVLIEVELASRASTEALFRSRCGFETCGFESSRPDG